jgi:hypothetical protein
MNMTNLARQKKQSKQRKLGSLDAARSMALRARLANSEWFCLSQARYDLLRRDGFQRSVVDAFVNRLLQTGEAVAGTLEGQLCVKIVRREGGR